MILHPILRKAEFSKPKEFIKKKMAKNLAENLALSSLDNLNIIKKTISEFFPESSVIINEKEKARVRDEADTAFVVDYPSIKVFLHDVVYKIRNTTAVCFRKSSTKNWSRVSLESSIKSSISKETNSNINLLADKCSEASRDIFENLLKSTFNSETENIGSFKIYTFGINDLELQSKLEKFDNLDLQIQELFILNPDAEVLIQTYFSNLFKIENLELNLEDKNKYWITSQVKWEDLNGDILDENVLYKVQANTNSISVFGLVYDNTSDGRLASLSSLSVSKHFVKRI